MLVKKSLSNKFNLKNNLTEKKLYANKEFVKKYWPKYFGPRYQKRLIIFFEQQKFLVKNIFNSKKICSQKNVVPKNSQ